MKNYLFYAGLLHRESEVLKELYMFHDSPEIYNGCYIYHNSGLPSRSNWYRGDFTPVLLEDVPKELLLLKLLLT